MIHPLLSPRLFFQAQKDQTDRQLPPPRKQQPHPVRDYAVRTARQFYLRWGASAGFITGVALALWALLPSTGG